MRLVIKYVLMLGVFAFAKASSAQNPQKSEEQILSFEEYLGYVKTHHPLMKQAEISLSIGEANLLKARGGFDPKIEVDYDRKKFKNTEYYDQLNATFKIPTWYGIEFKANFEENTGEFLNPNLTVPEDGLYSAGVSFSLAQGFLINERMAALRKARFFRQQTKADRDLLVNELLFEASQAYFQWLGATKEQTIYETFLENAEIRFQGVVRSVEAGDKAAIDSLEAGIAFENRKLSLEAANLKKMKASLVVSNFLWLNDIPVELESNVMPLQPSNEILEASIRVQGITDTERFIESHPKLQSLDAKIDGLSVERSLKRNKLLPKIDVQYNFLSPEYEQINSFNTSNYKAFVNFSLPLFLRKERGDLKLANLKLESTNFERLSIALNLQNKITSINAEINSLEKQKALIDGIVSDYQKLLIAEERKFFLGESSLFLINAREQKWIDAQLKENEISIKQLDALAKRFNVLGVTL